jgi:hypothetical protein
MAACAALAAAAATTAPPARAAFPQRGKVGALQVRCARQGASHAAKLRCAARGKVAEFAEFADGNRNSSQTHVLARTVPAAVVRAAAPRRIR